MIQLARIFQDGMVLQRQKPIKIWGETDRAQNISVKLDGFILFEGMYTAGSFSLTLPPQEAAQNVALEVSGRLATDTDTSTDAGKEIDHLIFRDIDIGEIWIAGGQSNMEFLLRFDAEADKMIRTADDKHLRFYDVGKYSFEGEEEEGFKNAQYMDKWLAFTPENAGCFSAVGLYFSNQLRASVGVPIGIIGCNWGGTTASAWLDETYLRDNEKLRFYIDDYESALANFDAAKYEKRGKEARRLTASKQMQRMVDNMMHGTSHFVDTIRTLPASLKVVGYTLMKGPADPNRPSGLYHTMVQKIAGVSCRGVIWYQGESDEAKADVYNELFTAVIRCWRDAWQDDLPFLFVQLAPYEKSQLGSSKNFPTIRAQQEWVSEHAANAYMVSIMDAGMKNDIHPKNKRTVGERLALMARGKIYDESILCDPPAFSGVTLEDGSLSLQFFNTGDGLTLKGSTLNALDILIDRKKIEIESVLVHGDSIEIKSNKITKKSSIELFFAWTSYCEVNLYNSAGLAAKPFRTQR